MNRAYILIVSLFLMVTLYAQGVGRNYNPSDDFAFCSDFNSIQECYRDSFFIHISIPKGFKLKCGYGACYSYYIPTGIEYVAMLTSNDNNCIIIIPAIRKGCHISVESILQSDFKHINDYNEHLTKTFGYWPRLHYNADTVYTYMIPEATFYNDYGNDNKNVTALARYPYNERVILYKKGQVPIPLFFVFTNKGYANKEFYFKAMENHIYFIKPESLIQLWKHS